MLYYTNDTSQLLFKEANITEQETSSATVWLMGSVLKKRHMINNPFHILGPYIYLWQKLDRLWIIEPLVP